jgi:hypothetical protein
MKENIAGGDFTDTGDHIKQRGFARAGFTRDPKELSLLDVYGYVIERCKGNIPRVVCFYHILHLDDDILIVIHTWILRIFSKMRGRVSQPHDQPRLSSRARFATRMDISGIWFVLETRSRI